MVADGEMTADPPSRGWSGDETATTLLMVSFWIRFVREEHPKPLCTY
jgi:hypothetical protein